MFSRFFLFTFIIYGGLLSGYFARKKGYVSEKWSKSVLKVLIVCVTPIIISFSLWASELSENIFLLTLPLIGAIICLFLIFPARLFAKFHKHNSAQTGSYLMSSMFSNIGYSWGGFLCLFFLGEKGLALAMVYSLYFSPMQYTLGFFLGRHYGINQRKGLYYNIKRSFADPLSFFPYLGMIIGVFLSIKGVIRPEIIGRINNLLVMGATFFCLFAVGLTIKFRYTKKYIKEYISISVVKFFISPVIALFLGWLFGYFYMLDRLPLKVLFIESFMPVAVTASIITNLFNTDQNLTNSCWLFTMIASFFMVPFIYVIINLF